MEDHAKMETPEKPEGKENAGPIEEEFPFTPYSAEDPSIDSVIDEDDSIIITPEMEKTLMESSFRQKEEGVRTISSRNLYLHVNGTENILNGIRSIYDEMNLIHLLRMRKLCESQDSGLGLTSEVSEMEGMLITQVFRKLFGYDDDWIKMQSDKFDRLKYPEYTRRDQYVQQYYKQFITYLKGLKREGKVWLIASMGSKNVEQLTKALPEDERQKIIKKVGSAESSKTSGKKHWNLVDNILPFYFIINKHQVNDVLESMRKNGYEETEMRALKREHGVDVSFIDEHHKNVFHYILEDNDFDPLERLLYLPYLQNRYGVDNREAMLGFMKRVIDEAKAEDEIVWKVLNGPQYGRSVDKNTAADLIFVGQKAGKLDAILGPFEGAIFGGEEVCMLIYVLENILGVRGRTNISGILGKYKIEPVNILDKFPLHDSKRVRALNEQIDKSLEEGNFDGKDYIF